VKPSLEVLEPGLLTTVQDCGRWGYQQYGMVVSGPMDPFALQAANVLVGNDRDEAGLEITMGRASFGFHRDCLIAIAGADLGATVDGEPVPMWCGFTVKKGQILRFQGPVCGVRAYLAVAGGIDVPVVMGSKSTYLRGRIGGLGGRALQKGDALAVGTAAGNLPKEGRRCLSRRHLPRYVRNPTVRVVLGPDHEAFTQEGVRILLHHRFTVTTQADRMGYRLQGPRITHRRGADILSDATVMGTVQVPADGQPIILMADRQTTGGYARIATVISADLPLVAQTLPGGAISFHAVSVEEAQRLAAEREQLLRLLMAGVRS